MKEKLTFTGHDKFYCRQYWLKKGLTHIESGKKFNDAAVVDLGAADRPPDNSNPFPLRGALPDEVPSPTLRMTLRRFA